MATLVNQVRGISKSSTDETSNNEVVDYIRNGVRYVLSSLPISLTFPFASDSSTLTTGATLKLDTNRIISVSRNNIKAVQVPVDLAFEIGDSNSIHAATNRYPAFYVDGNELAIKPDPETTAPAKAKIVDIVAISNNISSTDTSAIGQYDSIVIKYASALDYMGLSGYWGDSIITSLQSTSASTRARDALTNAQDLIDNKTNYDAEDFLAEEDPEMVNAAVQTAQQEVQRALAEMKGSDSASQVMVTMIQKAQELFNEAERELTISINQGRMNGRDSAEPDGAGRQ